MHRHESLARGYPATGFPDFDRFSRVGFLTRSPLQDQNNVVSKACETKWFFLILRIEPNELPGCSTPRADANE